MKATHNIVHAENYTNKDGEEKTRWLNVGVIITGEKNGKKRTVIKLSCMPINSDGFFNVFPIDENRGKTAIDEAKDVMGVDPNDITDEPINLDEIPF